MVSCPFRTIAAIKNMYSISHILIITGFLVLITLLRMVQNGYPEFRIHVHTQSFTTTPTIKCLFSHLLILDRQRTIHFKLFHFQNLYLTLQCNIIHHVFNCHPVRMGRYSCHWKKRWNVSHCDIAGHCIVLFRALDIVYRLWYSTSSEIVRFNSCFKTNTKIF